ncbi:MAG: hypothetical protein IJP86_01125 [Synergistaceae bacterium]|nr:hypothetical protein [Synergistaceae bacterium]
MALSNFVANVGNMIDGMIIGSFLGDTSLTAYGLILPVVFLHGAQMGVFLVGMKSCGGHAIGKGDMRLADEYFSSAFFAECALSVIIALILCLFPGAVAGLLGASKHSPEIFAQTRDYIIGYSLGIPFLSLSSLLIDTMYTEGKGQNIIISVIIAIAVNTCGDLYVSFTSRSMLGIGLATSASYMIGCLYLVLCRYKSENAVNISLRHNNPKHLPSIIKGGSTTGAVRASHMLRVWVLNLILTYYFGKEAVSALSIQNSVAAIFLCIANGTGVTILTIGSIFYGENNEDAMEQLMTTSVISSMAMCAVIFAINWLIAGPVVSFYTSNAVIKGMAVQGVIIFAFAFPFLVLNLTFMQYYMAVKRFGLSVSHCVLYDSVMVIASAFILVRTLGMTGVWLSFPVGYALSLIFVLVVGYRAKHKFPRGVSGCLLPFPEQNYREASYICDSPKQLARASEDLQGKAAEWGFTQSEANKAALCAEEYGMLLMSKAFHQTESQRAQNTFSIRMVGFTDSLLLRIQDTYPVLNSLEWMKAHQDGEADGDSLGIRMIFGSADNIDYRNILGLNTILITIRKHEGRKTD